MKPASLVPRLSLTWLVAVALLAGSVGCGSAASPDNGSAADNHATANRADTDSGDDSRDESDDPGEPSAPADLLIALSSSGGFANRYSETTIHPDGRVVVRAGSNMPEPGQSGEDTYKDGRLAADEMARLWAELQQSGMLDLPVSSPRPDSYTETVSVTANGDLWMSGGREEEAFQNGMRVIRQYVQKALERDTGGDGEGE